MGRLHFLCLLSVAQRALLRSYEYVNSQMILFCELPYRTQTQYP
jgi:hypothetical protein